MPKRNKITRSLGSCVDPICPTRDVYKIFRNVVYKLICMYIYNRFIKRKKEKEFLYSITKTPLYLSVIYNKLFTV